MNKPEFGKKTTEIFRWSFFVIFFSFLFSFSVVFLGLRETLPSNRLHKNACSKTLHKPVPVIDTKLKIPAAQHVLLRRVG
jgi:hypothetical protein